MKAKMTPRKMTYMLLWSFAFALIIPAALLTYGHPFGLMGVLTLMLFAGNFFIANRT